MVACRELLHPGKSGAASLPFRASKSGRCPARVVVLLNQPGLPRRPRELCQESCAGVGAACGGWAFQVTASQFAARLEDDHVGTRPWQAEVIWLDPQVL